MFFSIALYAAFFWFFILLVQIVGGFPGFALTAALASALTAIAHISGLIYEVSRRIPHPPSTETTHLLKGLLSKFPAEHHPNNRKGSVRRLAKIALIDPKHLSRSTYRILVDPTSLYWNTAGPVFTGFVVRSEDQEIWKLALPFRDASFTIQMGTVDSDAPDLCINLWEQEAYHRYLRGQAQRTERPDRRARSSTPRPVNPFLVTANKLIDQHKSFDRKGLTRLRRKVAKTIHPDHGQPEERAARTEALAVANARIDEMMFNRT